MNWFRTSLISFIGLCACSGPPPVSEAAKAVAIGEPAPSPVTADVFEKARLGWIGCQDPNETNKSCSSTYAFKFASDGSTTIVGQALMPASNPDDDYRITSEVRTKLEGPVFCLLPNGIDMASAKFENVNRPISTAEVDALRKAQTEAMKAAPSRTLCVRLRTEAEKTISEALVDGVHEPSMDSNWIWLPPDRSDWQVKR